MSDVQSRMSSANWFVSSGTPEPTSTARSGGFCTPASPCAQSPTSTSRSALFNFNKQIFTTRHQQPAAEFEVMSLLSSQDSALRDSKFFVVGAFSSFEFPQLRSRSGDAGAGGVVTLSMARMNKPMSFDMDTNVVTVEGGMTWVGLIEYLAARGRAVENTSAYTKVTLAGAAGTSTHGSGTKILSDQFESMEVVDASGALRIITNKRLFTHMGVLGVVVSVSLRTEPIFRIKQSCYEFDSWRAFDTSVIRTGVLRSLMSDAAIFSTMLRINLEEAEHPLTFVPRVKLPMEGGDEAHAPEFQGAPLVAQGVHEKTLIDVYSKVLADHSTNAKHGSDPSYFQAEFFVPFDRMSAAIGAVLDEADKDGVFRQVLPKGFKIRFVEGDDQYMSPFKAEYLIAFQLSLYGANDGGVEPRARVLGVLARFEACFARSNVAFTAHWGKLTSSGHAAVNQLRPENVAAFDAVRRGMDPRNRFLDETSQLGRLFAQQRLSLHQETQPKALCRTLKKEQGPVLSRKSEDLYSQSPDSISLMFENM